MYPGVGKSGSPAPKPITGRPAALRALALASTARVADSAMAAIRSEMRVPMHPWFQTEARSTASGLGRFWPWLGQPLHWHLGSRLAVRKHARIPASQQRPAVAAGVPVAGDPIWADRGARSVMKGRGSI